MDHDLSQKLKELTERKKIVWWKDIAGYHAVLNSCGLYFRKMGFPECYELIVFDTHDPESREAIQISGEVGRVVEEQIRGRAEKKRKNFDYSPGGCVSPGTNGEVHQPLNKFLSIVQDL
ncbi:MAG: hypothetical protein AAB885_01500 [Patescibacteria group bacterium]